MMDFIINTSTFFEKLENERIVLQISVNFESNSLENDPEPLSEYLGISFGNRKRDGCDISLMSVGYRHYILYQANSCNSLCPGDVAPAMGQNKIVRASRPARGTGCRIRGGAVLYPVRKPILPGGKMPAEHGEMCLRRKFTENLFFMRMRSSVNE